MDNFLSIIIPVHNREIELEQLLTSIFQYKINTPFEVIVVLDNCSDKTKLVCEKFNITAFENEMKKGAGYSRHFGAIKSKGNILLFLDSDTLVSENLINEMIDEYLKENGKSAICGDFFINPINFNFFTKFLALKWYYSITELYLKKNDRMIICAFGGGPSMISKELFFKAGGYDFKKHHYKSCGGEEFEAALNIMEFSPIYFYRKFNVAHNYRTVFNSFFLTIRRSFNYAMIFFTASSKQKLLMSNLVDGNDKKKLIVLFFIFIFLILYFITFDFLYFQFLQVSIIIYLIYELHFIKFIKKECGFFYIIPAILQNLVLMTSKGIGVFIAIANILILRKTDYRF
ncbi:glycosyltransferase [Candidatus Dependentiae bacterium]|nr:glycosyltransferase [Candidatus Dependentiae bacterium]